MPFQERVTRKRKPSSYKYTLHNSILQEEETAKYLGVNINNRLDWSNHINKIVGRAKGTLSFVQQNVQIGSKKVKETAYKSLILIWPKLEYASSVWDPHEKPSRHLWTVSREGQLTWSAIGSEIEVV